MTPEAQPPAFDICLSHSSNDKPWARSLRQALEAEGLTVFLDEKASVPLTSGL